MPQRPTSIHTEHNKNSPNSKISSLLIEKSLSPHNKSNITNPCNFTLSSPISLPAMTTPPSTPDKAMDIDPSPRTAPPSMKRKSTKNSSPTDSPKKSKKTSPRKSRHDEISSDPNYDNDFSLKLLDLNEDSIASASKNHLAQILALRVTADDKLSHFHLLLQLTRTRAVRILNSLRKKPLLRISSTTCDATIKSFISSIITHRDTLSPSRITGGNNSNANPTQEPVDRNTNSDAGTSTAQYDIKPEESPATTTKTATDNEEKISPSPPIDSDMTDKSITLPDESSSENASATASRSGITDPSETPNGQNIGDFLNDASDTTKSVSNVKKLSCIHYLSD